MAYWDIVYETINDVDREGSRIYVHTHNYEDDKTILVFDDSNSADEFGKLLKSKLENIPDVKKEVEDTIYDVSDRWEWWIEQAVGGDTYWTFNDEGFECSECYKWHSYDYYGGTSYQNYKVGDGWIQCEDCIKKNPDEYVSDIIDKADNANTILDNDELREIGFERVNDYPYANGWYGQQDSPAKILAKAKANDANAEYLFSIRKNYNPFEVEFDLWKRVAA